MDNSKNIKKFFIKNLSKKVSNKILFTYFKRFGKILDYIIIKNKLTGLSKGFGFITFENNNLDENIYKIQHEIEGKIIKLSDYKKILKNEKNIKVEKDNENYKSTKIFIGGLPLKTKLKEIVEYFSKYGEIIDKVIIKNKKTKISKGYGFIQYKNIKNANQVVKDYSLHEIRGKWIEVKYASPKYLNPKYNPNLINNENKRESEKNITKKNQQDVSINLKEISEEKVNMEDVSINSKEISDENVNQKDVPIKFNEIINEKNVKTKNLVFINLNELNDDKNNQNDDNEKKEENNNNEKIIPTVSTRPTFVEKTKNKLPEEKIVKEKSKIGFYNSTSIIIEKN